LQENRKRRAKARLDTAARQYIRSVQEQPRQEFDPAAFGFEFSLSEIERRAFDLDPQLTCVSARKLADAA
jgi:hypothetical protein